MSKFTLPSMHLQVKPASAQVTDSSQSVLKAFDADIQINFVELP